VQRWDQKNENCSKDTLTSIGDDDVDAPVLRDGRLEERGQRGPVAHVGVLEGGAGDGARQWGDVADEDVRAVRGEVARRGEADAGGAAWWLLIRGY